MAQVRDLGDSCWYGPREARLQDPVDFANIVRVLAREHDLELELNETSFFLSAPDRATGAAQRHDAVARPDLFHDVAHAQPHRTISSCRPIA